MRISDWSSDVCSSDLGAHDMRRPPGLQTFAGRLHLQKLPTLEFQELPARTAASPLGLIRVKACAAPAPYLGAHAKIGRASCRERVCQYVSISVVAVSSKKKRRINTITTTSKNR